MTILEQIHKIALESIQTHKGLRYGQALMNALQTVKPDWYKDYPSGIDPFYDNKHIDGFNQWVTNMEVTDFRIGIPYISHKK